jgi:hypothetical protein
MDTKTEQKKERTQAKLGDLPKLTFQDIQGDFSDCFPEVIFDFYQFLTGKITRKQLKSTIEENTKKISKEEALTPEEAKELVRILPHTTIEIEGWFSLKEKLWLQGCTSLRQKSISMLAIDVTRTNPRDERTGMKIKLRAKKTNKKGEMSELLRTIEKKLGEARTRFTEDQWKVAYKHNREIENLGSTKRTRLGLLVESAEAEVKAREDKYKKNDKRSRKMLSEETLQKMALALHVNVKPAPKKKNERKTKEKNDQESKEEKNNKSEEKSKKTDTAPRTAVSTERLTRSKTSDAKAATTKPSSKKRKRKELTPSSTTASPDLRVKSSQAGKDSEPTLQLDSKGRPVRRAALANQAIQFATKRQRTDESGKYQRSGPTST